MFIIGVKHSSAARDDWVSAAALASEKRGRGGEEGTLPPVQSHSIWHTCGCVVVSEAACMLECMHVCTRLHLRACMQP